MHSRSLFVVLVPVLAYGLLLSCSRSNDHHDIDRLAFIGAVGPDFLGVIKLDATTWEVMDSTSRFPGVALIGTSSDGTALFGTCCQHVYKIDIATMKVEDSLAIETDLARFLLIPEDDVVLRSKAGTLDIIDLSTLTIRERRLRPWYALNWDATTRHVVGCLSRPGIDSTIIVFDYEADTLIQQIVLRGTDGGARFVHDVLLDHSRNRVLAIGLANRAWFMAMDLITDSCLFQVSMYNHLGDIALSRDLRYCYVTNPGDMDIPGGHVYMVDAADYHLLHAFNGYDESLPATEWLVPGKLLLPRAGEFIVVVPSLTSNEGPLAVLNAETLTYLRGVRVWETPLQLVYSAAINF